MPLQSGLGFPLKFINLLKFRFMKKFIIALLFAVPALAQTDVNTQFESFEKELSAYRDNPLVSSENSTITPAPCGQYTLKYMVTERGTSKIVSVPPPKKLCADLARFDKSKNPNQGDWEYEIKPIGNRYYTIRGQKKGGDGTMEYYYYEHKSNK